MGKTRSKPLAARHGRGTTWRGMGTAWAQRAMCESAFRELLGDGACHILKRKGV